MQSLDELIACGRSDAPGSTGGGGNPLFHYGSVPPAPVLSRQWVVNASPLVILGKINQLPLLAELTETLVVPVAVAEEVEG